MMKIVVVAAARPNFMKVAPLIEALRDARARCPLSFMLVHTGQHYDREMSQTFFRQLQLPRPDFTLGVGSGTHAEQTGKVMIAFERLLLDQRPDWVIVVGDVNSTVACAMAAKKLGVRVAHVEAGLRSGDRTMPEEINRLVTDVICDALFTPDRVAGENLAREGIAAEKIHFVGNVMIDTLVKHRACALALEYWQQLGLEPERYATLTLHRAGNVDQPGAFAEIISAIENIAAELPVVFPIHPRTRKNAERFRLRERLEKIEGLYLVEPLGYLEMLSLNSRAALILTDSGGLQEEALALGVPCVTLRENTERPITIASGANRLVGNRADAIVAAVKSELVGGHRAVVPPELWDGRAARRIVDVLVPAL